MGYQIANDFIVCKLESAPGTTASISSSDFNIFTIDGSIKLSEFPEIDQSGSRTLEYKHGQRAGLPGVKQGSITFSVVFRHSGINTTPPKIGKLLQCCGLVQAIESDGVSWTSTGIQNDIKTITIAYYKRIRGSDNEFKKTVLSGCMGNCLFVCDGSGKPIVINFTFHGKLSAPTDETTVPERSTGDTTKPEKFLSSYIVYAGIPQLITAFSIDCGNTTLQEQDQGESNGISYFRIKKREPTLNLNPLDVKVLTQDVYSKFADVETASITLAIPTLLPKLQIFTPNAQIISKNNETRGGLHNNELTFQINRNSGASLTISDDSTFRILHGNA